MLLAGLLFISGCSSSTPNAQTNFNVHTGQHAAGWLPAGHMVAASGSGATVGSSRTDCHGADLSGGISGVSCTSCHLGGPTAIHPASWTLIYKDHGPYVDSNGTGACSNQYCHGSNLQGVQDSGPPCTKCHSIPYTASSLVCNACHGIPPEGTAFPNVSGRQTCTARYVRYDYLQHLPQRHGRHDNQLLPLG
jgi:hypothetical protein